MGINNSRLTEDEIKLKKEIEDTVFLLNEKIIQAKNTGINVSVSPSEVVRDGTDEFYVGVCCKMTLKV